VIMGKSNFNIKELESKFDSILQSITQDEILEWDRFDRCQEMLEMFYSGIFQPVEVSEGEMIELSNESTMYKSSEEFFDYTVNHAC